MSFLDDATLQNLESKANQIRQSIVSMLVEAKSGHTAGPLGMADIFTAFYFHILNHDPKNPEKEDRDRLILSNGHIVPVRYAAMAHAGYFSLEELKTLRKFGSRLQGHPERHALPGVETTSGPLGEGLSQGSGIAYAGRMDKKKFFTYVLLSDGEMQCGLTWEAGMFAAANKLGNLIAVIDRNNIQINGTTEDVMPLEPLTDKWRAFGWHVQEVDGHNISGFIDAINHAKAITTAPSMIIAHTIPGKGIAEIEYDFKWHGTPPNADQGAEFLKELRTLQGKIEGGHSE